MATGDVRRVTIYRAADGWRWRAQGRNWRIVDASEEGKQRRDRVRAHVEGLYPGAEIVMED